MDEEYIKTHQEELIARNWLNEVKGIGRWSVRDLVHIRRLMKSEYERGKGEADAVLAREAQSLRLSVSRVRSAVNMTMPKEGDLMEYDGDNHGDTYTAASNSTAKWFGERILVALDAPSATSVCPACDRGEKTTKPPESGIVGSMTVHYPSGNICQDTTEWREVQEKIRQAKRTDCTRKTV